MVSVGAGVPAGAVAPGTLSSPMPGIEDTSRDWHPCPVRKKFMTINECFSNMTNYRFSIFAEC